MDFFRNQKYKIICVAVVLLCLYVLYIQNEHLESIKSDADIPKRSLSVNDPTANTVDDGSIIVQNPDDVSIIVQNDKSNIDILDPSYKPKPVDKAGIIDPLFRPTSNAFADASNALNRGVSSVVNSMMNQSSNENKNSSAGRSASQTR